MPPSTPPTPHPSRAPSAAVAYVAVPFGSLLALIVLAAVHDKLGAPLGPTWAADLWGLVKSGAVVLPCYGLVASRVREHNARVEALYAAQHPRVTDGRISTTGSYPALTSYSQRDSGDDQES